jgi:DNA end-binding protein Ku
MPTRPTWSGSLQISLVSIAVRIFPAFIPGRQVEFHQINRKTHKRVHHENVDEGREVEKADVVKGYEYSKNKYIEIDPQELKALRIPTASSMDIRQFVNAGELSSALFERPYFVAPQDKSQTKALTIMRKALAQTDTLGIGEIAFSGREHLVAIGAPPDAKQKGLMLYLLRYAEELRDSSSVLSGMQETAVDAKELALAKKLIEGSTSHFDLSAYRNDYEAAVKKLVDAKRKGKPLPEGAPEPPKAEVIDIMDALRRSLANKNAGTSAGKKAPRRKTA